MHKHRLVLTALCLAAAGCNPDGKPVPPADPPGMPAAGTNRAVVVFDPTILEVTDTSRLEHDVLQPLRVGIASVPVDTWIDLYVIAPDHLSGGPEFSTALAFDPTQVNLQRHQQRADSVAQVVVTIAREAWERRHHAPERPASCILSTIRRAEPSLRHSVIGATDRQKVALVVISDLREACSNSGNGNLEDSVPSRLSFADPVNLAGVESVHLVVTDAIHPTTVAEDARLRGMWKDLLTQWHAPAGKISFDAGMPTDLF